MIPPEDRMRPADAGAILGISYKTAIRWGEAGLLKMEQEPGSRTHVLSRASVLDLAAARRNGVPAGVSMAASRLAELAHQRGMTLEHAQALVEKWWPHE